MALMAHCLTNDITASSIGENEVENVVQATACERGIYEGITMSIQDNEFTEHLIRKVPL